MSQRHGVTELSRTRFLLEWSGITLASSVLAWPLVLTYLHHALESLLRGWHWAQAVSVKAGFYLVMTGAFLGLGQGAYLWRRLDAKCGLNWLTTTVVGLGVGGSAGVYIGYQSSVYVLSLIGGTQPDWLTGLSFVMPWFVFAGLMVSLLQRFALAGRVKGGWGFWIAVTTASWCVAAFGLFVVGESMLSPDWSRNAPKLPQAGFGVLVGILIGIPVGVGTGLALNRILIRTDEGSAGSP